MSDNTAMRHLTRPSKGTLTFTVVTFRDWAFIQMTLSFLKILSTFPWGDALRANFLSHVKNEVLLLSLPSLTPENHTAIPDHLISSHQPNLIFVYLTISVPRTKSNLLNDLTDELKCSLQSSISGS